MITRNLSEYLAYVAFRRIPNDEQIIMQNINNSSLWDYRYWGIDSNSRYKIALGSGTTPPKETDYKLENQITDAPARIDMTEGMATASITYKNTTNSDIVATEIGLLDNSEHGGWLLARELFEKPVTIKAGETKSFSITLDFND